MFHTVRSETSVTTDNRTCAIPDRAPRPAPLLQEDAESWQQPAAPEAGSDDANVVRAFRQLDSCQRPDASRNENSSHTARSPTARVLLLRQDGSNPRPILAQSVKNAGSCHNGSKLAQT